MSDWTWRKSSECGVEPQEFFCLFFDHFPESSFVFSYNHVFFSFKKFSWKVMRFFFLTIQGVTFDYMAIIAIQNAETLVCFTHWEFVTSLIFLVYRVDELNGDVLLQGVFDEGVRLCRLGFGLDWLKGKSLVLELRGGGRRGCFHTQRVAQNGLGRKIFFA